MGGLELIMFSKINQTQTNNIFPSYIECRFKYIKYANLNIGDENKKMSMRAEEEF